eukprot:CAMPEP_0113318308 /NCGR_PEP_ID=MMETSP0010_2-20120614/12913_1 /TAXON_ID=216773 ORGANISM="Corethron hystrix, Strain 308" /NCGR_SAMPLE_ID=MMETSP0010_2 /ASSEMBLY_ACC=CAM_ASM_000155 /LENGTH=237 /DNA_ID=CAMNT_0000175553 /DNA_START=20 /DNA_END=733 /DNA_ORIENTATION=+ /assembly_acc=CAM_ASM_000155
MKSSSLSRPSRPALLWMFTSVLLASIPLSLTFTLDQNVVRLKYSSQCCGHSLATSTSRRSPLITASWLRAENEGSSSDKGDDDDDNFWDNQNSILQEVRAAKEKEAADEKKKQSQLYEQRSAALVADSAFFGVLFFSLCWSVATNPLTPLSYAIGASLGTAYTYGLGKFVQTIGGDINNVEASESGVGNARFAFLILLFVILGKFRGPGGLQEIPTIAGFFTYQLASLKQGLEEYDD